MSASFELDEPDRFTAGTMGPPGQRTFYLQARQGGRVVTLKCEKEQVHGLGEYLGRLLAKLPAVEAAPGDLALLEPVDPAWAAGSLGVGYEEDRDRIVVVATEIQEEEGGEEPATAQFRITRAQAAAFVERAQALIRAGRPICPMCSQAVEAAGHVCPRSNGHVGR